MSGFTLEWHGDQIVDAINEAAAEALQECGEDLLEKSKALCPKDSLELVESAELVVNPKTLSMRVGYGTDHAIVQHERQDFKHKPGEQAKFIEAPLNENGRTYLATIADSIKRKVFDK